MNPAAWVERHARRRPDDPALADGDRVYASWGEFAARTAGAATSLRDHFGLSPGDRVAIVMRNRPEYLEALFAIWHAGLVAVPVNARLHRDEIAYILGHSESAVAVTDADHAGDVELLVGTVASLKAAVVAPGERWDRLRASSPTRLVGRRPEDPAWLFYTSGTTGRPKGATLTHRSLLMATLSYFADIDPVVPQDCILHAAPLSHGSGLYGLPHVARGAVSVVPQSGGVDGDEIAALLRRWPGMSFFAAPTMVKRLAGDRAIADADLSHLKTIIYGGAPMYLADLEDALAVFGPRLAQIYGQGEAPMTITALSKADHADRNHPRWRDRMQSVGVPRTDVEVRVVDHGRELPADEVGEVVVRGDVVMAGYWNQPDATAEALREGWLYTGDIGSFDADGYLTLRDRSKDLIISGGMNIYPREVEEALLRHPGVRAAAVVGRPDAKWGEAVRQQIASLRRVWAEARHSDREHGVLGPPPTQDPGPPIWIGALSERGRQRAVELADGFIFAGAARPSTIGPAIQSMRPQVAERGKPDFSFNAIAFIAIGGEREFAEAVAHHERYYPVLPVPVEQAIHHGPIGKIEDVVAEYAASGLDLLVLMPEVRSLRQLELLSEHVLPEHRH